MDEVYRRSQGVVTWDIADGSEFDLRIPTPAFSEAVAKADFVHFLAYDAGSSTYLAEHQHAYEFVANNVKIMDNVFDTLRETGTPFYFASSQVSNVYRSTLGRLKAVGESYTTAIGGLNVQIWNVYGVEHDPRKTHVITDFVRMALEEGRILVGTDGRELRQFIHAEDAAQILWRISQKHGDLTKGYFANKAIPVTSYQWTSVREVALMIGERLDVPVYFRSDRDITTPDSVLNEPTTYPGVGIVYHDFMDLADGIDDIINNLSDVHES